MNGAGNDFVFLTRDNFTSAVSPKLARRLLDRHFGIGGDQLLILDARNKKKPSLLIYNSDGSQAEMCGNGVRAVAFYLNRFKGFKNNFVLTTKAGPIGIGYNDGKIEVDMGMPILDGERIPTQAKGPVTNFPLKVNREVFKIYSASMGNPHCVIYVNDVDKYPVKTVGSLIEKHPFFPKRVNVEFVQVLSRGHVKARVWERGAGETLACGTGACAIGVLSSWVGKTGRNVKVDLPGGRLGVRWGDDQHVYLTGPAEVSFQGQFLLNSRI